MLIGAKLERTRVGKNFYNEYFLGYKINDTIDHYEKVSFIEYEEGCKKLDECEAVTND